MQSLCRHPQQCCCPFSLLPRWSFFLQKHHQRFPTPQLKRLEKNGSVCHRLPTFGLKDVCGPIAIASKDLGLFNVFIFTTPLWVREALVSPFYRGLKDWEAKSPGFTYPCYMNVHCVLDIIPSNYICVFEGIILRIPWEIVCQWMQGIGLDCLGKGCSFQLLSPWGLHQWGLHTVHATLGVPGRCCHTPIAAPCAYISTPTAALHKPDHLPL